MWSLARLRLTDDSTYVLVFAFSRSALAAKAASLAVCGRYSPGSFDLKMQKIPVLDRTRRKEVHDEVNCAGFIEQLDLLG